MAKIENTLNRPCSECELCNKSGVQFDLRMPNLGGVTNPKVLFVFPYVLEGENNNLPVEFMAKHWDQYGFDFTKDCAAISILKCSLPEGLEEKERKKLIRKCFKSNFKDAIGAIDPMLIVLVGEECARYFPKAVYQESKANKFTHSYRTIVPDRVYYYLEDPYLILDGLQAATDKYRKDDYDPKMYKEFCKTLKYIKGSMRTGIRRKPVEYTLCDTLEKVYWARDEILKYEVVASDIETNGIDPYKDGAKIITISFSWREQQGICIPLLHRETPFDEAELIEVREIVKQILTSPVQKIFHNGKFDCQFVYVTEGYEVVNFTIDTMLAHYVIICDKGQHSLKRLALQHTDLGDYDASLDEFFSNHKISKDLDGYNPVDLEILWAYNCCDTDATLRLWNKFANTLQEINGMPLFLHLMNLSDALMKVERNGFILDQVHLQALDDKYIKILDDLEAQFMEMPEVRETRDIFQEKENKKKKPKHIVFNLASSHHMKCLFWDVLKLREKVDTSDFRQFLTGAGEKKAKEEGWKNVYDVPTAYLSTSASVLAYLDRINAHRVVKLLQKFRSNQKLYSSYIEPAKVKWVSADGLIHPTNKIHGTVSGRLACEKPNMQQIPRGKDIKKLFISRYAGGMIAQLDYSQVEFRVASMLSEDPTLIEAYMKGLDIHRRTAAVIYGIPDEEVTKEQRQYAKTVNFGLIYGKEAYSLSKDLGITQEEAEEFMRKYFERFPMLEQWLKDVKDQIVENEESVSMFGRSRKFPGLKEMSKAGMRSKKFWKYQANLREGINHVVQSTAADFTLYSLIVLQKWLENSGLKSKILGTVHDSILLDLHPDEITLVMNQAKAIMEGIPQIIKLDWVTIPIKAEGEVGHSWGVAVDAVFKGESVPSLPEKDKETGEYNETSYYDIERACLIESKQGEWVAVL